MDSEETGLDVLCEFTQKALHMQRSEMISKLPEGIVININLLRWDICMFRSSWLLLSERIYLQGWHEACTQGNYLLYNCISPM